MARNIRQFPPFRRVRPVRQAFTLIEASLTTIIVGTGVLGMIGLFTHCTTQNRYAARVTTGMMLCHNIQECMANLSFFDPQTAGDHFGAESGESLLSYDDVDDFDGLSFSPPIDSLRETCDELDRYTQTISVVPVYGNGLDSNTGDTLTIPKSAYTGAVRVRVIVTYRVSESAVPERVTEESWIRVNN
jgi:Tfp pilus assembly protein PilV